MKTSRNTKYSKSKKCICDSVANRDVAILKMQTISLFCYLSTLFKTVFAKWIDMFFESVPDILVEASARRDNENRKLTLRCKIEFFCAILRDTRRVCIYKTIKLIFKTNLALKNGEIRNCSCVSTGDIADGSAILKVKTLKCVPCA
jgi:hypothetical protein